MKKLLFIPLLFGVILLSGCGMTNEEIVKETKICHEAGLQTREILNGFTYDTIKVICEEIPIIKVKQ